jgi:hypothetical protein
LRGHEDAWDAARNVLEGRRTENPLKIKCYSKHPLGRVEVAVARLEEVGMKN